MSREGFRHDRTTDEVLDGIDLTGQVALVTGGSRGIGVETAREAVAESIRESTGNPKVEVEELELGSLKSIRAFADRFLKKHDRLNILINNAGVMACPQGTTEDGFEMQFGTNHIGHFLMTCLIAPALIKGSPSRI